MRRASLIAGNWKMYKTRAETRTYAAELAGLLAERDDVEVALCVPFTALGTLVKATRGSAIAVYAQNMHEAASGAFTGEVSAPMLLELGVSGVVLGHSERRRDFGETDRALAQKVPAALAAGLAPILCVGESEEERLAGGTERKLRHQVQEGLEHVPHARLAEVAIAYEPIWAIGTGKVATAEQAQEAASFIRALVGALSAPAAALVRVLYGGSVTAENAGELLALPDVDGALVGGASLEPASFAAIASAAPRIEP
jgi:triosephosphate isomerase (TIM)